MIYRTLEEGILVSGDSRMVFFLPILLFSPLSLRPVNSVLTGLSPLGGILLVQRIVPEVPWTYVKTRKEYQNPEGA
jgi:hypothetical protein